MRQALAFILALTSIAVAVAPAQGGSARVAGCGVRPFSYAGVQSQTVANGISATLRVAAAPSVSDGHVGGWIGLGGTSGGPGGRAEWIQAGFAAFSPARISQMYYEVTVAGSRPKYVELSSSVEPGASHRFAVLELAGRASWWRVWVDGKPASPPIFLPGSDGKWYPQAVAENWNGNTGACNDYSYRFSDVSLLSAGRVWRPLQSRYVLQDTGYHVVSLSKSPTSFLAASLVA